MPGDLTKSEFRKQAGLWKTVLAAALAVRGLKNSFSLCVCHPPPSVSVGGTLGLCLHPPLPADSPSLNDSPHWNRVLFNQWGFHNCSSGALQMGQLMVTFFFQGRLSIKNGPAISDQKRPVSPNELVGFRMK